MSTRLLFVVALCLILAAPSSLHAYIYRWDTNEAILGTRSIEPGPGLDLTRWNNEHYNLRYADFSGGVNLSGSRFAECWLDNAHFIGANLTGSDLRSSWLTRADLTGANLTNAKLSRADATEASLDGANLTDASLYSSTLTDANLNGAVVTGADFSYTTSGSFTASQLYSTQSYQARDLSRIALQGNDLTGWDFSGQNLTNAYLSGSTLTQTNLSGAIVTGTVFEDTTSRGFTKEQLYSTASYAAGDLQRIRLLNNNLTGWDFSRQNLTNASLHSAMLTNANLSGANLTNAHLPSATLSQADLNGANLTDARLDRSTLTDANLSGANLTNAQLSSSTLTRANLSGAVVAGASFFRTTWLGFTQAQLASTASYQAKNLQGIVLYGNNLIGWDFSGQNLANARLDDSQLDQANLSEANLSNADFGSLAFGSMLRDANLTGANLKNANLLNAILLRSSKFSPESVYNQWTVFPTDFSPAAAGLTLAMSPTGDLDANDALDAIDVDMLTTKIRGGPVRPEWLPDAAFDMNVDGIVNEDDHRTWVKDLKHTWYGDADLDAEFNSNDFVQVFQAGKYEAAGDASWSEGDWNGDGVFNSDDFVTAFADGGYEQGPRTEVVAVPEPGGVMWLVFGLAGLLRRRTVAQVRSCRTIAPR